MTSDFDWPSQYSFPPFFTIQPNAGTRKRQMQIWSKLIRNYCKSNQMYILEKSNVDIPLFNNGQIGKHLSVQEVETILDDMSGRGEIEWINAIEKDRCFVFWHSPTEWGNIIYSYAESNGLAKSVATLFELTTAEGAEFSGMDITMLIRCLKALQTQGKAELMGDEGVKFF